MQNTDVAYCRHQGVLRETEKAVCYQARGVAVWVPRSQIVVKNRDLFGVPKWWAVKKGLDRDW